MFAMWLKAQSEASPALYLETSRGTGIKRRASRVYARIDGLWMVYGIETTIVADVE